MASQELKFSPLNSTFLLFCLKVVPPKLHFLLGLQIPSAASVAHGNMTKSACVSTTVKNEMIPCPGTGDRWTGTAHQCCACATLSNKEKNNYFSEQRSKRTLRSNSSKRIFYEVKGHLPNFIKLPQSL